MTNQNNINIVFIFSLSVLFKTFFGSEQITIQNIDRIRMIVIFVDVLIQYQVCHKNASRYLANRPLCFTECFGYY